LFIKLFEPEPVERDLPFQVFDLLVYFALTCAGLFVAGTASRREQNITFAIIIAATIKSIATPRNGNGRFADVSNLPTRALAPATDAQKAQEFPTTTLPHPAHD